MLTDYAIEKKKKDVCDGKKGHRTRREHYFIFQKKSFNHFCLNSEKIE